MTITASHMRGVVLLSAAIVIFAESTKLGPGLQLAAIAIAAIALIYHLGDMYRSIRARGRSSHV
jgi:hypothetical protein